ncbi:MAG: hypothetical protein ACRDJN_04865 [Chloroflexota bacterium]
MDLSALHVAVRKLVQGGAVEDTAYASAAEGRALRALEQRLHRASGQVSRMASVQPQAWWFSAPVTVEPSA